MSQNIINEVTFLLHSFLLGIAITFAYDGFLVLRRLVSHSLFLISLEDMIFGLPVQLVFSICSMRKIMVF